MNGTTLVIEDDLSLKPLWESISRRLYGPNKLDWAVSAEEARRLYRASIQNSQPYSIVAVDLFLAGSGTGLDFIKYVRTLGQTVPILLMSTVSEADLKCTFDQTLEPVIVLTKPLNLPKCELALDRIIQLSLLQVTT